MIPVIKIIRDTFTVNSTAGKLYMDDEFFCYTLEDVARAEGVKIKKETCIPAGMYKVAITFSNKYQKEMPVIYTEDDMSTIKLGGVKFAGCRFHGGNSKIDTEGCPLVAYRRINADKIYKTASVGVKEKIEELIARSDREYVHLYISNKEYNG